MQCFLSSLFVTIRRKLQMRADKSQGLTWVLDVLLNTIAHSSALMLFLRSHQRLEGLKNCDKVTPDCSIFISNSQQSSIWFFSNMSTVLYYRITRVCIEIAFYIITILFMKILITNNLSNWISFSNNFAHANSSLGICGGGVRVKAACEMPRPYVRNVEQAQGRPQVSKSSLTFALSWGQYFVKSIRTVTTQDQSQKAKSFNSCNGWCKLGRSFSRLM